MNILITLFWICIFCNAVFIFLRFAFLDDNDCFNMRFRKLFLAIFLPLTSEKFKEINLLGKFLTVFADIWLLPSSLMIALIFSIIAVVYYICCGVSWFFTTFCMKQK